MKRILSSFALMGAAVALNAQVLNYGFETTDQMPGAVETVNFYEDLGLTYDFKGSPAHTGEYAFFYNAPAEAGDGQRWERVLRFTNLPIQENKSYRVSVWVNTNDASKLDVAILRGELDADMALVVPGATEGTYQEQTKTLSGFFGGQYVRKTAVFWAPTMEQQLDAYSKANKSNPMGEGCFLRLSFTSTGDYLLDDILIEESAVENIAFNGDQLRVDFGYETNLAALVKAGTTALDASAVQVTINGEAAAIESVELKEAKTWKAGTYGLYVFLTEDYYMSPEDEVTVSFTNPGTLTYATNVAPEAFTTPNAPVYSFTGEKAWFEEELAEVSEAYEEPELVTSNPVNDSFEIDGNISEFSFTYNKNVLANSEWNGAPTAVLAGEGIEETLALKAGQPAASTTLTFVRTGSGTLANGSYVVTVANVSNEKDVVRGVEDAISFEVGRVVVAETKYTELPELELNFDNDEPNTIPMGWYVNFGTEVREPGSSQGSGPRLFNFPTYGHKGLYIRTDGADDQGFAFFGDYEDYQLTLPAGDIEVRVPFTGWKATGKLHLYVIDADNDEIVGESEELWQSNVNGDTNATPEIFNLAAQIKSDGGKYKLKVQVVNGGGMQEAIFFGAKFYSFVRTEGDVAENEVYFREVFATVDHNIVPAAGLGWTMYELGTSLVKGSNGSGASSRVFAVGARGMEGKAMYFRTMEDNSSYQNYYATYGEDGTYVKDDVEMQEPTLELPAGKLQFTYYGAGWKSDALQLQLQLLNADKEAVMTQVNDIPANMNGDANAAIDAVRIQFNYVVPAAGRYILRFSTNGEAMFGNVTIEKQGSLAVEYHTKLKLALADAAAELENAADDKFAGTTRTALQTAYDTYKAAEENATMHSREEYEAAIAEIEALIKKMQTRRAEVGTYDEYVEKIPALLDEVAGTKYEALEAYGALVTVNAKYAAVTAQQLEDDALIAANQERVNGYNLLNNLKNTGVGLLTDQLAKLAALVITLDETVDLEDQMLVRANAALTDDQALAHGLKLMALKGIYNACATGNPFETFDEEYQQTVKDSIDVTCFAQNVGFYTTLTNGLETTDTEVFPGWTVEKFDGMIAIGWSWDGMTNSATNPVVNAKFATNWGTHEDIVRQTVTLLPVGAANVSLGTCDRSHIDWKDGQNVYKEGEMTESKFFVDADSIIFNLDELGQYYGHSRSVILKDVKADEGKVYGQLTTGAMLKTEASFASVDDLKIFMTGKAAGFDYVAAAAAIAAELDEFVSGIPTVEVPAGEPIAVRYYDLSGRQVATPQGICIKIALYANGVRTVSKMVVK